MPQPQSKNVNKVWYRVFVNNNVLNGESMNWKADWKRFSGMSYASVLKSSNQQSYSSKNLRRNILPISSVSEGYVKARTCTKSVENKGNVNTNALVKKQSDVTCNITTDHDFNTKTCKAFKPNSRGSISLHNRFNVLANINSGGVSEKYHSTDHVNLVNEDKYTNSTDTNLLYVQMQSKDTNVNSDKGKLKCSQQLYDIKGKSDEKKTVTLIETDEKYDLELRFKPRHRQQIGEAKSNPIFQLWDSQTKDKYGFIPLGDLKIPKKNNKNKSISNTKVLHETVKNSNNFNFMQAQVEAPSQLNPDAWDEYLVDYWDKQLCFLIRYRFPLDFKKGSPLQHELKNHSMANIHTDDMKAYLQEESQFGAIFGPFDNEPLDGMHFSPFLTRDKPGAPHRRVIVDLSYPEGMSVNAGVDSDTYLETPFLLTLPTLDNITQKVKENGKGSLLYKIDLSRAFRHVKLDPRDCNLLGLFLDGIYYDSCLPFGFKHGSGIFQRMSDAVRYIMSKLGFQVTNYIDDIIGHSISSQAAKSFETLHKLLSRLGFDISVKKMVTPSTKVTCLGVQINTVDFIVSITTEKVQDILRTCNMWRTKTSCSKRELQSLLGKLLYITKCVKSSRFFLNRMLELLRNSGKNDLITLTAEFHRDLNWFCQFVPKFNGSAFFVHSHIHHEIELDACLQGLGARWGDQIYSIQIHLGHEDMTIVHLEMLNILVAIRTWGLTWTGKTIRIHCDNQVVVSVLTTGKTKDSTLAAIASNIFMETADRDICLRTVHIRGKVSLVYRRGLLL